jgi:hypothetical protein
VRRLLYSEEVLQAIEEHIDHMLRFSINFKSVSARISSRESQRARCCYLVCCFLSELQVVSRYAGPLESWWLADKSSTLRLSVERR